MDWDKIPPWAIWPALAVVAFALWYMQPDQHAVRECDAQIKAKLRAPSSYRRLDYYTSTEGISGGRKVHIEYEAQNSFGVSLRDTDDCTVAY